MLGKVIAWADSRGEAGARLRKALGDIEIVGVVTNRALLCSVLADEEFRRGAVATNFLERRATNISFGEPQGGDLDVVLAGVWCATRRTEADALWADTRGWRLAAPPSSAWTFADRTVTIECSTPDACLARLAAGEYPLRVLARGAQTLDVEYAGQIQRLRVIEADQTLHLFRGGRHVELRAVSTEDALRVSAAAEEGSLVTPLPGTLVAVHVTAGQQVVRGAPLVTVEAMKMEHTLTAPYDGTVTRIAFGLAERVAAGAILVDLAPLAAAERNL